jgi:hypothetical protein
MVKVVQSACPKCKRMLRIPARWINQAMRCKHCGLVMEARAKAGPAAATNKPVALPVGVSARTPVPPTRTVQPVAIPVAAAPANPASPFALLDAPSPVAPSRQRRPRSRGTWWKGVVLGLLVLGTAVTLAVFAGPQLSQFISKPEPQAAVPTKPDEPQVASVPPRKDDLPRREDPKKEDPPRKEEAPPKKEEPPKKEDPPKKPPMDEPKKPATPPDTPKKPSIPDLPPTPIKKPDEPKKPVNDLPKSTTIFPRRALAISVNNYLYFNPTNYGLPGRNSHSVLTLLDQFNRGLHIPLTQQLQLSDAAPANVAKPPLKPVIESTITNFLASSRPQDRLLLLFVGHYVEMGDEVFLVPIEGERDNKETLIPLTWVYKQLEECKARQKVLILDVCRFNPTRGLERPGSGPEDAKVEGAMGPKLDALLQKPPEGVQVWSSCLPEQFSYEYDDANLNNGVFLEALHEALGKALEGTVQQPEDALPLPKLVETVNKHMEAFLKPFKKTQTSRLTGSEPAEGAPYDAAATPPVLPAIKVPVAEGGAASGKRVQEILQEIEVPPLKANVSETPVSAQSLPPFAAKVLDNYVPVEAETPFRTAVKNAQKALQVVKGKRLKEQWLKLADEKKFKEEVKDYQMKEVATIHSDLIEVLEQLKKAGEPEERAKETSKRWLANYDYLLARLENQIAYFFEYQSLLGSIRKELPPHDPMLHNGWRIAAVPTPVGDSTGKKLAADAKKVLEKMGKDYAGTPWEVLAKRDRLTSLGLEWQATKIGEQR